MNIKETSAVRIRRMRRNLRLTGAIVTLSVGVLLPVFLSSFVGIMALVVGDTSTTLIFGVLVISFTAAAIGGAIIVTVLLSRRARLARFQGDLLANVTHELRTPLAAIRMYAQTLEMGLLEQDLDRSKQSVATIIRETEWLEAMIDRVITWRSASKDRDDLDTVTEPLGPVVEETANRFQRMITPDDCHFTVRIESTDPVEHDKRAVSSLLLNLLTNAYKYTKADKKIQLAVLTRDSQVVLSVRDNGVGISEKEMDRVFDPFYRTDSSLRGKSVGAGLGLAIVRHWAQAHSAQVYVESRLGQGSCFLVHFPIAQDPDREQP
jgi:signal transduction histidine kinase